MSEHILIQREGPAVRVVLNRPEKRNAFNGQTIDELMAAFTALSEDEETRVIILAAEGKTFCAGADLSWMRELAMSGQSNNDEGARRMAGLFGLIDQCRKPVIARVHGATIGGGTGIVAACDIPVASAGAKFGFSEVRLGLAPAVISPYVVARIGTMAARALFVGCAGRGLTRMCARAFSPAQRQRQERARAFGVPRYRRLPRRRRVAQARDLRDRQGDSCGQEHVRDGRRLAPGNPKQV